MVLFSRKPHITRKIYIRGYKHGAGILDVISGLPWSKILPGIGAAAASSLTAYGANKAIDYLSKDTKKEIPSPLGVPRGEAPQQEILPVMENNVVHSLPDVRLPAVAGKQSKTIKQAYVSAGKQSKKPKTGGKIKRVDQLLDQKSMDILKSLKIGKGIYNL